MHQPHRATRIFRLSLIHTFIYACIYIPYMRTYTYTCIRGYTGGTRGLMYTLTRACVTFFRNRQASRTYVCFESFCTNVSAAVAAAASLREISDVFRMYILCDFSYFSARCLHAGFFQGLFYKASREIVCCIYCTIIFYTVEECRYFFQIVCRHF